jgi:hypothetical protein
MRAAALAAMLALAICLAACGGGEEETGEGQPPAPAGAAGAAGDDGAAAPPPTGAEPQRPGAGTATRSPDPAPSGDSVSPRSAPFRGSEGPLKNVPEYGAEASAEQREQAQGTLTGYLSSAAAGDWGRACGYLAPEFLTQVRELTGGAGQSGSCGETLPSYLAAAGRDPAELRDYAGSQVASLRVKADGAFALIHGDGGEDLWVAMKLRGGDWKLLTPVPQRL